MKIYKVYYRDELIGKVLDYGEGLIDAIHDLSVKVEELDSDDFCILCDKPYLGDEVCQGHFDT